MVENHTPTLLPCAFCGGDAEEKVGTFTDIGHIRCTDCDVRTDETLTRELAYEIWNRRSANPHEALVEALADAQAALAMMIAPDAIDTTTVVTAFAAATAAEAKARAALSQARA